jgi:hypothetical protein
MERYYGRCALCLVRNVHASNIRGGVEPVSKKRNRTCHCDQKEAQRQENQSPVERLHKSHALKRTFPLPNDSQRVYANFFETLVDHHVENVRLDLECEYLYKCNESC